MRGLIAFVLVAPFLLGLAGCERAKTKLDREVDRLCAIDGGVHIYETVTLSKENFGPNGEVFPQHKGKTGKEGRYGPDYWSDLEVTVLVAGDPSLQRNSVKMIRNSDGKILGEFIDYKRSGGDFPGPWEPSRKSCLQSTESGRFYNRIFIEEES